MYEQCEEFLKLGKFYQQDQSVATFLFWMSSTDSTVMWIFALNVPS